MAIKGVNPARVIGNGFMENDVLKLGKNWTVLQSAYTTAGGADGGRPEMDDTEVTKGTERQKTNESNKTENRI